MPQCLLNRLQEQRPTPDDVERANREHVDRLAIDAVMETECRLGREPREMPHDNPGYDIESKDPVNNRLRFIEVKGKTAGSTTVTISKTQILTAFNKPDDFILAIVEVDGDKACSVRYVRHPFQSEPDFGVVSVNYDLEEFLARSEEPA